MESVVSNIKGTLAWAGRVGSRVERSKGLKDTGGGLGCVLDGGAVVKEAMPPDEIEGVVLHGLKVNVK